MIENRSALIEGSADSSAIITGERNTATITITNYYYHENKPVVPIESTDIASDNLKCPYRGLFHFGPDDAEFFFGRQVFVEELLETTRNRNFIPILGASGSGKSSVVLAGLVPKLRKEGNWLFTHFRPGADPFYALALALVPLYTTNLNATEQIAQARELAGYFRDNILPVNDIFAQIEQNHPNYRVLLIADQFEELYTLCNNEKTRRSFLDILLAATQTFSSKSKLSHVLVATIRADFLGNVLSYRPLADVVRADIKLPTMNRSELTQVIQKPALKLGVTFQDGLIERILDDVNYEPGNLPLLEFALTQLWKYRKGKQLTHTADEEIGEVSGALTRYADDNYAKLNVTQQDIVRRIFIQLVRPGEGTEDTRRLATKTELGEANWKLVKHLADIRLVVTSQNAANQETVEVVHEALIKNWDKLIQWMKADRRFRAWQERLRGGIYQWEQMQRDEGALLLGAALVEAQERLKQHREDLGVLEQEFIQASIEARDHDKKRKQRRKKLTVSGLVSVSGVVLGLAGLTAIYWRIAEINQINTFAQSSDALLNSNEPKAVGESVKAAVKMKDQFWVDANTRTQVELALLDTVHNVAAANTLGGHAKPVYDVSFSSDGKILASASGDKMVKLWDISTGKEIKTLIGHTNEVRAVSFSFDSKILASASADNTLKLWDTSTGKEIKTLIGHTHRVNDISFSKNGKMLTTASDDNTVILWNTSTGKAIKTLVLDTNPVYKVSFSSDGQKLATAGRDKTVKLWDTNTGKEIKTLTGHKNYVRAVSFSPNDKMLATASNDKTVKLWDTNTGKEIKTLTGHKDSVNGISFSPDGKMLASSSGDKTVKLWDTTTLKEIKTLSGHTDSINRISFSADGKMLATASRDTTVKLWNTSTLKEIKTLTGHRDWVYGASFSFDNKILATASRDKTVKLWNTSTGQLFRTLTGHTEEVYGVSFRPDGKMLATASGDKTVKLWDTSTGKEITTLTGHKDWVNAVSFSFDNKMLATASSDKTVKLWDTSTFKEIKTLNGHTNSVYNVNFSRDGKMLATASGDKTVKLWNTSTFKEIKTLTGHKNWVLGVSFSFDGKMLATASSDKTVKLWDTSTFKEINTLTGHKNSVNAVSFSRDGKMLATASSDKTVRLWDTSTGFEIKTLTGYTEWVNAVSFSPNGKMLATGSRDNTVRLWRWDFDYLLNSGCNFMREYFKTNPPDDESEKHLCDRAINPQIQ